MTCRCHFSLKGLFVSMVAVAIAVGVCGSFARMRIRQERERHVTDQSRWPRPIQAIVNSTPGLASSIKVYDLGAFFDSRKMIAISGHPEIISRLIHDFGLVKTNRTHPLSAELIGSIPDDWRKPGPSSVWYASPGFGTTHQEGVDLFLLATEPSTGDTVILYNWIF